MNRALFETKLPGETKYLDCHFYLPPGVSVTGQSVAASVESGTDPAPSAILSGAATTTAGVVSQKVTGGVAGVIYQLLFSLTTAEQTFQRSGLLAVTPA